MAGKVENKTKHALRYKTRTKPYGLGIKYGLRYKTWTEHYRLDKTRRKVQNTDFLPSDHGSGNGILAP